MDSNTDVTAKADSTVEDRFVVETNVVPESAEPESAKPDKAEPKEVEPKKDKTTKAETPDTEPKAEPTEPKPINPRTAQRKAEKERLLMEVATLREQVRNLQPKPTESEQPKARDLSKEPNILDYDDVLEYNRDLARYDRRQESLQENLQKQTEALAERAEIVRAEKPDYDERVSALLQSQLVTPDIEKVILASPIGADIAYHLASYGADLMTLRGLPPESLPKAIKAVEAFIKKGGEQEKPRITKAAPPITPPGVTANTGKSISSYTQEEYENAPLSELRARKLI